MRSIAAEWSIPERQQDEPGSSLLNIGTKLRKAGSARIARCQAGGPASALPGRGSHQPFVQADVAAFISAFMRIG